MNLKVDSRSKTSHQRFVRVTALDPIDMHRSAEPPTISVCVASQRRDDEPWEPPTLTIESCCNGVWTAARWRLIAEAAAKAFEQYNQRFTPYGEAEARVEKEIERTRQWIGPEHFDRMVAAGRPRESACECREWPCPCPCHKPPSP